MSDLTPADLATAYAQLTGSAADVPAPERLEAAIAAADDTIARYLGGLAVASGALAGIARDLALYDLAGQAFAPEHPVYARWKAAMAWLDGVASGRIAPPESAPGVEPTDTAVAWSDPGSRFAADGY